MSARTERLFVMLITAGFVLLAVGFSLGPIFEGPDEIEHYRYIRILNQTGTFPDPYSQPEGELHQSPLYYLVMAPFSALLDDTGFADIDGRRNPYHGYAIGIPSSDNKNVYVHTRTEDFPYTESPVALKIHLLRLLSVAIGTGTLLTGYAVYRRLWPERPDRRLAALGFTAFLPQFAYMSGVLSNDNLLYLLTALSLLLLVRQAQDGPSWRLAIWLGLALGGALLAEISAAFLVFPVGLATLSDRRTWRYAVVTLAVTLLVSGWWYARNLALYDDITGVQAIFSTWEGDAVAPSGFALDVAATQIAYAYRGFWARFGYGAVAVGEPLHAFFAALTALTLGGAGVKTVRHLRRRDLSGESVRQGIIVAVFGLTWAAALFYWSGTVWTGNQGRFLLSSLPVWGALFAFGMDAWTPQRARREVALTTTLLMAAAALISLFGYFYPAYRVNPVPSDLAQPLDLHYENADYDASATLLGMAPAAPSARPGETITITLYWQANGPTSIDLQTYLHTADADLIRRDSLPGTGNRPSTDWQPGETWAETYVITIPENAEPQRAYPLIAGLFEPETDDPLPATNADGEAVTPFIGRIAVNGEPAADAGEPVYCLGDPDAIGITDITTETTSDRLDLCITWLALADADRDYQMFVHILDTDGAILTQADVPPTGVRYPTGVWLPGEVIEACAVVDLADVPAEVEWRIGLGLYSLVDSVRLPADRCDGERLPNDIITVTPEG